MISKRDIENTSSSKPCCSPEAGKLTRLEELKKYSQVPSANEFINSDEPPLETNSTNDGDEADDKIPPNQTTSTVLQSPPKRKELAMKTLKKKIKKAEKTRKPAATMKQAEFQWEFNDEEETNTPPLIASQRPKKTESIESEEDNTSTHSEPTNQIKEPRALVEPPKKGGKNRQKT